MLTGMEVEERALKDNARLAKLLKAEVTDTEVRFWGGPFSSFAPFPFMHQKIQYPTREHFFQAQKTHDQYERNTIILADSPALAKKYGGQCTLREDWEEIKFTVMCFAIGLQFEKFARLRHYLVETDDRTIIEDSPYDMIWGGRNGGQNLLGKAWMQIRARG